MRLILALFLALLASPASVQAWDQYSNSRYGYSVDVPPGFSGRGESDNGDGQAFVADGRPIDLQVWGGTLLGGFEGEVAQRMALDEGEAWNITYQATTPRWASWSAIKGSRILYQRMVVLCEGTGYAAFRTEYSVTDSAEMDPVVERLVQSLRGTC